MKESWEDNGVEAQAKILAFDQIVQHDDDEREAQLAGARKPFGVSAPDKPASSDRPVKRPAKKARSTRA